MTCSEQTRFCFATFIQPVSIELKRLGERYPDGSTEEACTVFSQEVAIHKAAIALAYRNVVTCLKGSDDLDEIVKCWEMFVNFADNSIDLVRELKERFLCCGTPELYNELLEYRVAACKRRDQAIEEKECQSHLPEGLFQ